MIFSETILGHYMVHPRMNIQVLQDSAEDVLILDIATQSGL